MKTKSQNKQILSHLNRGWKLTGLQALEKFDCFRLPSRIHELRSQGHDIRAKTITTNTGKRIAQYYKAR